MLPGQNFDAEFQQKFDGPLTDTAIARVQRLRAKSRLSLAEIAAAMGISGPFLSNLLRRAVSRGNVAALGTAKNADRLKAALLDLERRYGLVAAENQQAPLTGAVVASPSSPSLDALVRAIHGRGFAVTLTPLTR